MQRNIEVIVNNFTYSKSAFQCGVNLDNLLPVETGSFYQSSHKPKPMKTCLMNTQSARSKTDEIVQYIIENDIDATFITETWISENDQVEQGDLKPSGYDYQHIPRKSRQGGGIAVIYRSTAKLKLLKPAFQPDSFELLEAYLTSGNQTIILVIVYCPQRPDPDQYVPTSVFMDEFKHVINRHISSPNKLLVLGDFNFHMDIPSDPDTKKLQSILKDTGLEQQVHEPMHILGHTLDLIITRKSDTLVSNIKVDMLISDHFTILFDTHMQKPPPERKRLIFRKIKSIDVLSFRNDVKDILTSLEPSTNSDGLIQLYNTSLQSVLDKHAPLKQCMVTVWHHTPYYTDNIRDAKAECRLAEKQWRNNKTQDNRNLYKSHRNNVSAMLKTAKTDFYHQLAQDKKGNPKGLHRVISTLLHNKQDLPLPPHEDHEKLANDFASYFTNKIDKIRQDISAQRINMRNPKPEVRRYSTPFTTFKSLTEDEVCKILMDSSSKSCELDPVPTWLLKLCCDEILPLITQIVNVSLSSHTMPKELKIAAIRLLLKKSILELIFKNYRPVSNLPFLGKVIEKVALAQLLGHVKENNLHDNFQSAYQQFHSTETALLTYKNYVLSEMDKRRVTLVFMFDLSAVFDTIGIMLQRLSERFSVQGDALKWIQSYISDHEQYVCIDGRSSERSPLSYYYKYLFIL